MPDHTFLIGQIVRLLPTVTSRNVPGGVYEVTKQLPESSDDYRYRERQYRIKSIDEPYERVVRESQLFAVGTLVSERPPHRSARARFGHSAPPSGV